MDSYAETLDYLYNRFPMFSRVGASAYKTGLDNTLALDEYFGHPHRKFRTVHVAGTNGKGSVSNFLASVLQTAGYKVGLYTSPHLVDFRERIRVAGAMIPQDFVVDFVQHNKAFFEEIRPSFFEMTVLMAFDYFAKEHVDVAVVEVGLGGRLDSTNIITPDVSIITNISYDHQNLLGDTLAKIAAEKAGIIKRGVPVVVGEAEGDVYDVFEAKANSEHAQLFFAPDYHGLSLKDEGEFLLHDKSLGDFGVGLHGDYQQKNVATVLTAVDVLRDAGYGISDTALRSGLLDVCANTGLQGRWQVLRNDAPKIVCDIAHNTAGIAYIVKQMRRENRPLRIVFGVVSDKDVDGILSLLPPEAVYYFTRASIPRALDERLLCEKAAAHHLKGEAFGKVTDAAKAALQDAQPGDFVYVGGSNFVVADALTDMTWLSVAH